MSIWGKIAGVAAGYAIGGVPGAVFERWPAILFSTVLMTVR